MKLKQFIAGKLIVMMFLGLLPISTFAQQQQIKAADATYVSGGNTGFVNRENFLKVAEKTWKFNGGDGSFTTLSERFATCQETSKDEWSIDLWCSFPTVAGINGGPPFGLKLDLKKKMIISESYGGTTVSRPITVVRATPVAENVRWVAEKQALIDRLIAKNGTGATGGGTSVTNGAQVQNVALGKPARQSSTAFGAEASRAVDGNTNGLWSLKSVTHAILNQADPWWEVDLGALYDVSEIKLFKRTDCCTELLQNYRIQYSDQPITAYSPEYVGYQPGSTITPVSFKKNAKIVRYIRVSVKGNTPFYLAEVQVFGVPSNGAAVTATAQNCSLADWAGEWNTNINLLSWNAQGDGSLSGTFNTQKNPITARPVAGNPCMVEGTYSLKDGVSKGRIRFGMDPDKRSFTGAWYPPYQEPTGTNWTGTKKTPAVSTATPAVSTATPAVSTATPVVVVAPTAASAGEVKFYPRSGISLAEAKSFAAQKGWQVATPEQVAAAWKDRGLQAYAFGRTSDGKFCVPVQQAIGNFKRGANCGVTGGNQGFLYVDPSAAVSTNKRTSYADYAGSITGPPRTIGTKYAFRQLIQIWNQSVQHPSQQVFGLGDAVMLRKAAELMLRSQGKSVSSANVDSVLKPLSNDATARFRFAPFLLKVTYEALSAPQPDAGQLAFRENFAAYMGLWRFEQSLDTLNRWNSFKQENERSQVKTYEYGPTSGNFLPMRPADVPLFLATHTNPMLLGNDGRNAVLLLLEPAAAANLPEFRNSRLGELGADMNAVAVGIGVGTTIGTSAGTLALLSAPILSGTVVGSLTATSVTTNVANSVPMLTLIIQTGKIGGFSLGAAAGMGIAISIALAVVIGVAIARQAISDQMDRRMKSEFDRGFDPVDVYSLINDRDTSKRAFNRAAVFGFLLKMLIADPADRGKLTLAIPEIECGEETIKVNSQLCVWPVKFHSQAGLSLQQAESIANSNGWTLATPEEVEKAWEHLNLDAYAFGRMSDGRFAVPVQSDHTNFKKGVNIGATGGNQGFFYTVGKAKRSIRKEQLPKIP